MSNQPIEYGDSIHTYFCPNCRRKLSGRDLAIDRCLNCNQSLALKDPVEYNNTNKKMDNYRWNNAKN